MIYALWTLLGFVLGFAISIYVYSMFLGATISKTIESLKEDKDD